MGFNSVSGLGMTLLIRFADDGTESENLDRDAISLFPLNGAHNLFRNLVQKSRPTW
jgi:hypothetical protein